MQNDNEKLIKSTNNLSKEDMNMLREKFVVEYSRKKGWDKSNLSPNQFAYQLFNTDSSGNITGPVTASNTSMST